MSRTTPIIILMIFISNVVSEFGFCKENELIKNNDQNSQLVKAYNFFERNIIGRTITTPMTTYEIGRGKMEADFTEEYTFKNLIPTKVSASDNVIVWGFTYDWVTTTNQTNYELDENGKRTNAVVVKNRTNHKRCYVSDIDSTGDLLANCLRLDDNLQVLNVGVPGGFQIKVDGNKLLMISRSKLYGSCYSAEHKTGYYPCSSDWLDEYFITENGKLRIIQKTLQRYEVNPVTWEFKPITDEEKFTIVYDEE